MSVVDINTVRLDNFLELIDETLSCGFNTQDLIYFNHIITISFSAVDLEV